MADLVLRHFKFPCTIIWRDPEEGWEACEKLLQEEIAQNGFKSFKKLEPPKEANEQNKGE